MPWLDHLKSIYDKHNVQDFAADPREGASSGTLKASQRMEQRLRRVGVNPDSEP